MCIAKSLFTVALVAWVGVIVGGIFLGRLAFSMKWTKAVIYAITTVNTSGLVAPPSGILAAAYVLVFAYVVALWFLVPVRPCRLAHRRGR